MEESEPSGEKSMKVLELYCGHGGWSKPFAEDGAETYGVDITDFSDIYPGTFLQSDMRDFSGLAFKPFDLVIGSPPCNDFSTSAQANRTRLDRKPESKPDEYRGMELFGHALRVIGENKPRFWALENVWRSRKFIPMEAQWTFRLSPWAKRLVWTNIPLDGLAPDHVAHYKLEEKFAKMNLRWAEMSAARAEIPYPIARYVADSIKIAMRPKP